MGVLDYELKNMVCNGCVLNKVCWERELRTTFLYLENCFAAAQSNGLVTVEEMDNHLRQRCSRPRELVMGINCCYQLWRMQHFMGQRLQESRELVSVQLRGMRGVIENLARELEAGNDISCRRAEYLKQSLKQSGIPVADLTLYPCARGCEVEVVMPACTGKRRCVYDVAPFLNQLTEDKLFPSCADCINWQSDDFCTFRLYPNLVYQLSLGLARCTAKGNDISGDNCAVMHLNDGQLAILISDGMGSGAVAASESKTTLSLLQQLIKAGYSLDLAIRMVNSVMMHHCPEEDNFATVDMCVVDLYGGKIELVKIGAPTSFLVRQNQVQVIQASSLPVGIVDDINIFLQHGEMNNGDMLVMVTDGVTDAYPDTADNEEWIASVLREIVDLPPQEVAELILRLALSGSGEVRQVADDMTVLVARVKTASTNN
jgi:stage II sporulation protein E